MSNTKLMPPKKQYQQQLITKKLKKSVSPLEDSPPIIVEKHKKHNSHEEIVRHKLNDSGENEIQEDDDNPEGNPQNEDIQVNNNNNNKDLNNNLSTSSPEVYVAKKQIEKTFTHCKSDKNDYRSSKKILYQKKKSDKEKAKQSFSVSNYSELPEDIKKKLKSLKIDEDIINANFESFIHILRYTTKDSYHVPGLEIEKHEKLSNVSDELQIKAEEFMVKGLKDKDVKKKFKSMESNGRGGFGRVFSARVKSKNENGKSIKEIVAIKRLPCSSEKEEINNKCEITCLLELSHPNIVQIKTAYQLSNEFWIIMEFMEGGTLNQAIRSHTLSPSHIYYISQQILSGIEFIHSRGFAHRDIKSNNIMLSINGAVKIIDFGLCADLSIGPRIQTLGTAHWMAPEIITRQPHTNKVDIWAFGIVFLEMFVRTPPFSSSRILSMFKAVTGETLEYLSSHKIIIPKDAYVFVDSCLLVDPLKRASATELLQSSILLQASADEDFQSLLKTIFVSITLHRSGI